MTRARTPIAFAIAAFAVITASTPSIADITWNWSFSGEEGTFQTDGGFSETASAGTFAYLEGSFDVTTSMGGIVQATDPTLLPYFAVGSNPVAFMPGDLVWSGSAVSAFDVPGSLSPTLFQGNASSMFPLRPYIYQLLPATGTFLEWTGSTFNPIASGPLTVSPAPAGEYTVQIDRFELSHSAGSMFVDEFDDGTPPPSIGYNVVGAVGPESGGILILDESDAVPSLIPGTVTQVAIQLQAMPFSDDIVVSGLYDLAAPHPTSVLGQAIFLSYLDPDTHAHTVIAALQSNPGSPRTFILTDFDTFDGTAVILGSVDVSALFAGPVDQIELVLTSLASSGIAGATLNVFDGGVFAGSTTHPDVAALAGMAAPSAGFQVYLPEPGMDGLFAGVVAVALLGRHGRCRRGRP